jgi:hypothetical protein
MPRLLCGLCRVEMPDWGGRSGPSPWRSGDMTGKVGALIREADIYAVELRGLAPEVSAALGGLSRIGQRPAGGYHRSANPCRRPFR